VGDERVSFATRSQAAAFTWTFTEQTECTGPMSARLWLELNGCADANLYVGVEKWRDGRFVPFEGSFGYGRDRRGHRLAARSVAAHRPASFRGRRTRSDVHRLRTSAPG
jgi:predicted acyl esterase